MPQMASMEKNDPIDNLVEHLKYKIQRSRQWTKHTYIDSIRKDDLFYNLILFYLYSFFFVLFCFVSLNVFVVPPLPTGLSTWLTCATFSDYFSDVALCHEWKIHSSAQFLKFTS